MAFAKRLCSGSLSRSLSRAGSSNGNARGISSALAEAYYNDEQKEMMAAAKKLIDAEINPVSSSRITGYTISFIGDSMNLKKFCD